MVPEVLSTSPGTTHSRVFPAGEECMLPSQNDSRVKEGPGTDDSRVFPTGRVLRDCYTGPSRPLHSTT